MHTPTTTVHVPVLLTAVLSELAPCQGESYVDMTAGYGGYAQAVLDVTKAPASAVLVDRDEAAVKALQPLAKAGATVLHSDFYAASQLLAGRGRKFDMVVADLGVSSAHVDRPERGFAFGHDGPLDMRMDTRQSLTAATVVNTYAEPDLQRLLREYGEEPRAGAVARAIVAARPLQRTAELAEVIRRALPGKRTKTHPATRSFQALRIAVNDELGQLERSLPLWLELLAPQGRLAVVSFHSLEDRAVKRAFQQVSGERYDAEYSLLTKHPVVADDTELACNPRARSAKLRVLQRK